MAAPPLSIPATLLAALMAWAGCTRPASSPAPAAAPRSPQGAPSVDVSADPVPDGVELVSGQRGPENIAVDSTFVYWTNYEDDAVMRVKKDGSAAPSLIGRYDAGQGKAVAVDDSAVYWGLTALRRENKSTGEIRDFNAGGYVTDISLVGDRVYWAGAPFSGGSVRVEAMPRGGGKVEPIGPAQPQGFRYAVGGGTVCFGLTVVAGESGEVTCMPERGGRPTVIAKTESLWSIIIDGDYIYWMEGRHFDGAIKRRRKDGRGEAALLTQGVEIDSPQSMTSDARNLYWTQLGFKTGLGALGKVSKSGGDARFIARNQVVPQGIAVDETSVYWVNYGPTKNGTVRRLPK